MCCIAAVAVMVTPSQAVTAPASACHVDLAAEEALKPAEQQDEPGL
jgi:hypothetical protein